MLIQAEKIETWFMNIVYYHFKHYGSDIMQKDNIEEELYQIDHDCVTNNHRQATIDKQPCQAKKFITI